VERRKSQSKCRSDEHVLHKDTYYIINVTETRRELQLERMRQRQREKNCQCGAPEQADSSAEREKGSQGVPMFLKLK